MRATVHQLSPPFLLPTLHTPLFLPAKSALLRRGSLHQGPFGSPVLRLTFPSFVATQYNNEVREGKDEMEDGGKRSLRGGRGQDEAVDDGLWMTGNCTTAKKIREAQK